MAAAAIECLQYMARMLQALKNLEARSIRPTARKAEQMQLGADAGSDEIAPLSEVEESALTEFDTAPRERVRPARRADVAVPRRVLATGGTAAVDMGLPQMAETVQPAAVHEASTVAGNPPAHNAEQGRGKSQARRPSALERQVRSTLNDPVRSRPLIELGERIQRDAAQAGSKVIALVGVGAESATHESALYAATVVAERTNGRVLIVDADLARRTLSEALEYRKAPGFGELLCGGVSGVERCQPTTVEKLMFLPAGGARQVDFSSAGSRLDETLKQLADGFSLVLIDGGRTVDSAVSSLARQADATYFVVQLGTLEASEAQAALRDFRAAGARVAGCVAT